MKKFFEKYDLVKIVGIVETNEKVSEDVVSTVMNIDGVIKVNCY